MTTEFTRPLLRGFTQFMTNPCSHHGNYAPNILSFTNERHSGFSASELSNELLQFRRCDMYTEAHCSYTRGALYFTHHISTSKLHQTGGKY